MVRDDQKPGTPHPISARFFLWTIREQDYITRCVTTNIWAAVSALMAIAVVGFISLEIALEILLFGGMAVGSLLWILIERRRSWLLGISEPKLKSEAHQVMTDYLAKRLRCGPECRKNQAGSDAFPTA